MSNLPTPIEPTVVQGKMIGFHAYRQNNTGGDFVYNAERGISVNVIVQGIDSAECNKRAERIGLYFDGCEDGRDCPCCGDRWYSAGDWRDDLDPEPLIYGEPVDQRDVERKWITDGYETFVHYLDGRIVGYHGPAAPAIEGGGPTFAIES